MKTKIKVVKSFMFLAAVPSGAAASNSTISYLIGGVIALFILGYLVFTLIRPEKF